jgi:hypothetical protein
VFEHDQWSALASSLRVLGWAAEADRERHTADVQHGRERSAVEGDAAR